MKKWIGIVILVASLATAHADPRPRSTAYVLSGLGTGASLAIVTSAFFFPDDNGQVSYPVLAIGVGSALITPSLGNFYVENWLNIGMGVRIAAGAAGAYVAATMRQDHRCSTLMDQTCTELTDNGMIALGVLGIIFVGGAAYDFKALDGQIDSYNAKHAFQWAPAVTPSPSGRGAVLGVGGTF